MVENPIIMNVVDQILDFGIHMIILFNTKYDLFDNLTSFKLCVIVLIMLIQQLEYTLYLELECETRLMFCYMVSEWSNLCDDDASFAEKISKTG